MKQFSTLSSPMSWPHHVVPYRRVINQHYGIELMEVRRTSVELWPDTDHESADKGVYAHLLPLFFRNWRMHFQRAVADIPVRPPIYADRHLLSGCEVLRPFGFHAVRQITATTCSPPTNTFV